MSYFTKWPEAYAIPNQEASRVPDALVTNLFCQFGPLENCTATRAEVFSLDSCKKCCSA